MKKKKLPKSRNPYAYHAIRRSGAGKHRDKKHCAKKYGCRGKVLEEDS